MPTTAELTGWAQRLAALLDELPEDADDATILDALHVAADAYEAAVADKVEAIGHVLDAMATHRDICRAESDRYSRLAKRWHTRRERVRDLLGWLLHTHEGVTGSPTVRATSGTATLTRRTRYTYPDEIEAWPEEWIHVHERREPRRKVAQAAIDAGEAPEGFGAEVVPSVLWRPGR